MYKIIIVGGGIVGLATAREYLNRFPNHKLLVLEKEALVARHQSSHNSGVLHTGIYYKPGSLKAKLCVNGHAEMRHYCDTKNIPYQLCGKVIVALNPEEEVQLNKLYERGHQNGVKGLELIGPERLRELEPYVVGSKAIWSPNTGSVNYNLVALAYADDIREAGGRIITNCKVLHLVSKENATVLETTQGDFHAEKVITCAGLYSDHISGEREEIRIIPFRGSYYRLTELAASKVNGLIYPVPNPEFPFLGVHFTRTINDEVWVGPNAVPAFAREGYNRWHLNLRDLSETLTFSGFWKLATTYWKTGLMEIYRDFVKAAYVKTARAYIPDLAPADFVRGPAGVRAQALRRDGQMEKDFLVKYEGTSVHIQNAPSPAATSSLVLGREIVRVATMSS